MLFPVQALFSPDSGTLGFATLSPTYGSETQRDVARQSGKATVVLLGLAGSAQPTILPSL
jgi:hypothetical protein